MTLNKRRSNYRLDHRDPLVEDTRELGRRPGSMRLVQRDVPSPAGIGLDTIHVPAGAPLALDLQLQAVTEGVLVTGTVTTPVVGECGRCLDPIEAAFSVEICELFAYPDSSTDRTTDEDEVERIEDDLINLEPVVRDAVVLGLPVTPLCRSDCAGLCPNCGQRLDDVEPGHTHEQIDSRWAGLATRFSTATDTGSAGTEEE